MSVSLWRRRPQPEVIEADICIVGAGVCGVSCALEAEARGLRAVVIERAEIAAGASGRSAGFLMRGMAESYAASARALGRDHARLAWRWSEENLELLKADGATTLDSFRNVPSCLLALNDDEARDLEQSAAMLREDGFEAAFPWRTEDTVFARGRPVAALLNPRDAAVNPVELCRMLAAKLRGPVIERQEAHAIDSDERGVTIRCADVHICAPRALLCINAWAGHLIPALARAVQPNRGQMLAARIPGCRLDASYYANRGADYLRQTTDGLIVAGGQRARFAGHERTTDERPSTEVQQAIERFVRELLGTEIEVVARWAGIMGFSPDGLPLIGPLPTQARSPADRRVWFCGGFTGHGMSLARRAGREAVEAMLAGRRPAFSLDRLEVAGGARPDPVC